jgi:hypothetical protein
MKEFLYIIVARSLVGSSCKIVDITKEWGIWITKIVVGMMQVRGVDGGLVGMVHCDRRRSRDR